MFEMLDRQESLTGNQKKIIAAAILGDMLVFFGCFLIGFGLALVVGSSNVIKPKASVENIMPAFLHLASWFVLAGAACRFLGIEPKGRSIEQIDRALHAGAPVPRAAPVVGA
jgi:hypothetical protein